MRLIRTGQADADAKAKKERDALDRDCRKTGGGRNACAPPTDFVPEDGNFFPSFIVLAGTYRVRQNGLYMKFLPAVP